MSVNQPQGTLLCFRIVELRFAIPIHIIRTVIRAVAVTPIADTSKLIEGIIDFRGKVIPVINLRPRFNLPIKEIEINQQFIVVKYNNRRLAIIADSVEDLISPESLEISNVELPLNSKIQHDYSTFGVELMQFHTDKEGVIVLCDLDKLIGSEGILEISSFFSNREQE